MPAAWVAAIPAVASIAGGIIQGNSAQDAANTQAQAIRDAAAQAQFRPVGVTTNFGTSNFGYNDQGQLASAGYNLSPQLQGLQGGLLAGAAGYNYQPNVGFINGVRENSLAGMRMAMQQAPNAFNAGNLMYAQAPNLFNKGEAAYGQGNMLFGQAANLFPQANAQFLNSQQVSNAGAGYLSQDPAAAQAAYLAKSQAALAPGDEQALASLRNRVYQTGRAGLATGGTTAGGLMASNPELAAYYNSLAQRNLTLNANAAEQARADTTLGSNLYGQSANIANAGSNIYGQGANVTQAGGNLYNVGANQYGTAGNLTSVGNQSLSTGGGLLTTSSNLGTAAINQELGKYQIQNAALNTLGNYLGQANTVESMGQQGLNLGSALGARTSTAGAAAIPAYTNAANAQYNANAYNPYATALTSAGSSPALNTWFSNVIGGNNYGGTPQGAYGQQNQYLAGALSNPQTQQAQMLAAQNQGF
jgi:hypothetical protein